MLRVYVVCVCVGVWSGCGRARYCSRQRNGRWSYAAGVECKGWMESELRLEGKKEAGRRSSSIPDAEQMQNRCRCGDGRTGTVQYGSVLQYCSFWADTVLTAPALMQCAVCSAQCTVLLYSVQQQFRTDTVITYRSRRRPIDWPETTEELPEALDFTLLFVCGVSLGRPVARSLLITVMPVVSQEKSLNIPLIHASPWTTRRDTPSICTSIMLYCL